MPNYITKRGYFITINDYPTETINTIIEELTVKPNINEDFGGKAKPFKVYRKGERQMILPKFYGIKKFGEAENRVPEGLSAFLASVGLVVLATNKKKVSKETVKTAKKAVKEAKKVTKDVKKITKKATKDVKKITKKATKDVKKVTKKATKDVKKVVKKL